MIIAGEDIILGRPEVAQASQFRKAYSKIREQR
jgi:hypothetical protein